MRINSNVTPTPIVSVSTTQNQNQNSEVRTAAPAMPPVPKVETGPMTVDLGDKIIELNPGELAKVVEKANETARVFNHSLEFQMSQGKQIVIRVVDTTSGQVVREIPPEKFMDAFKQMEDAVGLLLDLRL
ncbi:MAG TPA: flagellar protein FlaG [Symbiobacteriaceae bacterium]|nr:flagellar protein FlaG [Symbiobacteriaceae bacterium]